MYVIPTKHGTIKKTDKIAGQPETKSKRPNSIIVILIKPKYRIKTLT